MHFTPSPCAVFTLRSTLRLFVEEDAARRMAVVTNVRMSE